MNDARKRIKVLAGDITRESVDVIVNAANNSLLGGGGVDGAIHRAAGPELLRACRALGGCPTGQAKSTGGYNLPAGWVIHTVGPVWRGGKNDEDGLLASAYRSSLHEALRLGAKTAAFPAISTGVYGFPRERAAAIAVRVIAEFLREHEELEEVRLVCFSEDSAKAHREALENYFAAS